MQIGNPDNFGTVLHHQDWDRNCESHRKLKQELRMTIMAKRHARGEEDIKIDFSEPETRELSEAELERKERRKEQNRKAAQRCRRKKRLSQMSVLQNYEAIVTHNQQLTEQVKLLRRETQDLQAALQVYRDNCTCPARDEPSPKASSSHHHPPLSQTSFSSCSSSSSLSAVASLAPQVKQEPRDDGSPCDSWGGCLPRDCGPPGGQGVPMGARSIPFQNILDGYEFSPYAKPLTSSAGESAQGGQSQTYYNSPEGSSAQGVQRFSYHHDPPGVPSAQEDQLFIFHDPPGVLKGQGGHTSGYHGLGVTLAFLDDWEADQHPRPLTSPCHYVPADSGTSPSSSPCGCSNCHCSNNNSRVDINGSRVRTGLPVPQASQQQTRPTESTWTTHDGGSPACPSRLWCDPLTRTRWEEILRESNPPRPAIRRCPKNNWPFSDPPRRPLASYCHFQNEVSGPHSADGRRSISSVSSDVSGGSERPRHDVIATPPSPPPPPPQQQQSPSDVLMEGLGGDAQDEMARLTSSDVSQILAEISDCDDILDDDVFLCPDDPPDRSHPFQPML